MSPFTEGKDSTIVSTEEKQCPYCGMMVVAYANFCTNCGERIGSKKCPQCGKTVEADARFCSACGTRLDGGAAAQIKRDTHQYVDLGLPSGTLWATCNVGASNPEDYGDYFAWGETATKTTYSWSNYKHGNGNDFDMSKKYNKSDGRTQLERIDDVASQDWGCDWFMPTQAQFQELKEKCTWTWTKRKDKKGYEAKGPNGNTIFLPAAGYKYDSNTSYDGAIGYYWSSSLYTDFPDYARRLYFNSSDIIQGYWSGRRFGQSVRPVRYIN